MSSEREKQKIKDTRTYENIRFAYFSQASFQLINCISLFFSLDICTETIRVVFTARDHKRALRKHVERQNRLLNSCKFALLSIVGRACKLVHWCNNVHTSSLFWFYKSFAYVNGNFAFACCLSDNSAHVSQTRPNEDICYQQNTCIWG